MLGAQYVQSFLVGLWTVREWHEPTHCVSDCWGVLCGTLFEQVQHCLFAGVLRGVCWFWVCETVFFSGGWRSPGASVLGLSCFYTFMEPAWLLVPPPICSPAECCVWCHCPVAVVCALFLGHKSSGHVLEHMGSIALMSVISLAV